LLFSSLFGTVCHAGVRKRTPQAQQNLYRTRMRSCHEIRKQPYDFRLEHGLQSKPLRFARLGRLGQGLTLGRNRQVFPAGMKRLS
jgi:hypothetical protein